MPFAFHYAARSDVGMVRSHNEDSGYAGPHLLAMADGMGGHAGGDVASSTVIAALVGLDDEALGGRDVSGALLDRVLAANADIGDAVRADSRLDGMGTTLIALLRARDKIVLAHIGDSRAFLVRDGAVTQITKDHSFGAEPRRRGPHQRRGGADPPAALARHAGAHRCVGGRARPRRAPGPHRRPLPHLLRRPHRLRHPLDGRGGAHRGRRPGRVRRPARRPRTAGRRTRQRHRRRGRPRRSQPGRGPAHAAAGRRRRRRPAAGHPADPHDAGREGRRAHGIRHLRRGPRRRRRRHPRRGGAAVTTGHRAAARCAARRAGRRRRRVVVRRVRVVPAAVLPRLGRRCGHRVPWGRPVRRAGRPRPRRVRHGHRRRRPAAVVPGEPAAGNRGRRPQRGRCPGRRPAAPGDRLPVGPGQRRGLPDRRARLDATRHADPVAERFDLALALALASAPASGSPTPSPSASTTSSPAAS